MHKAGLTGHCACKYKIVGGQCYPFTHPFMHNTADSMLIPVILCGGSGSRLWPLSRDLYPKQFLSLTGGPSLLQATVKRAQAVSAESPVLVSNEAQRFLVAEQVSSLGGRWTDLILEPVARNTAPAIAAAALRLQAKSPDAILLVMPSDQQIDNTEQFAFAVQAAVQAAEQGRLVTFGVQPTYPATGYGYIRATERVNPDIVKAWTVAQFVEKPDAAKAQAFLQTGEYLWNSGMFVFKAAVFLEELARHAPAMLTAVKQAVNEGQNDLDFFRLAKAPFASSPSDSIDYAVMEKTDRASVVSLNLGWNDVGAWDAVWDISGKDANGNACTGDVMLYNTRDTLVHASGRMVATIGVDNLVVVETADAVMVSHKDRAQDVKKVVEALKAAGRSESQHHREVFRPWGSYDSIGSGSRFQVKRIVVKPGARLSLQMHHHRAEHWIVVSGTARVRKGTEEFLMTENQSCYIPVGETHFLENPGVIPLELIEVQSGSYLGEDDIVRFEDRYGRA